MEFTFSEIIQIELALQDQRERLLSAYELIEGESEREAARRIIQANKSALEKVTQINYKYQKSYED